MSQITTTTTETESLQQMPIRLPESLHRRFKVRCAHEGTTMQDVVAEAVRLYVESPEAEGSAV